MPCIYELRQHTDTTQLKDKYYELFRGPGKSGAGSSSDADGQREFDGEEALDNLHAHPQWAVGGIDTQIRYIPT